MTPQKLPDGRWRVRASVTVGGSRRRKLFTADRKADAVQAAREWEQKQDGTADQSLADAVEAFLDARAAVLSPSTLRGYRSIYRTHLAQLDLPLRYFDSQEAQRLISGWAGTMSRKTLGNVWQLLSTSVRFARPELALNVRLPQERKAQIYCPDDTDIRQLLASVAGTRMQIPVELAAFIPARRSEICALRGEDVKKGVVTIRRAMVREASGLWVVKDCPKTSAGYRSVKIPESTAELLPKTGPVVDMNPDQLSHAFRLAVKKAGLPHFRFHDLRHYGASVLLQIGIPVKEVQRRGGWDSVDVLQRIYAHALRDQIAAADQRATAHFANLKK